MRKVPRGLSSGEQTAWARLAESVTPLPGRKVPRLPSEATKQTPALPAVQGLHPMPPKGVHRHPVLPPKGAHKAPHQVVHKMPMPPPHRAPLGGTLDSHWERRMKAGKLAPDLTLDLHDHSLDAAYARIMAGLDQARSMGARVVLVIAGRERPVDPADRSQKRGAIRAKLLDWLAASHHGDAIAAFRKAHRSHGGEGAVYLVLKRRG